MSYKELKKIAIVNNTIIISTNVKFDTLLYVNIDAMSYTYKEYSHNPSYNQNHPSQFQLLTQNSWWMYVLQHYTIYLQNKCVLSWVEPKPH